MAIASDVRKYLKNWMRLPKSVLAATIVASSLGVLSVPSAEAGQLKAVVEMFTSQGCSSCPPADKILGKYADRKDVLALSWHVDYWNYLGWNDTFSKAEFTERQYRYAASFRRRGVYTPQAVVNGRDHVVGSHGGKIENLINTYDNGGKGLTVPVNVTHSGNEVRVTSGDAPTHGETTLWIVYFDKKRPVKILRGENRGETIEYHNIVRSVSLLGMAKGGKLDVTLPMKELKRQGHESCALILQRTLGNGLPGPIVGATVIDDLLGS